MQKNKLIKFTPQDVICIITASFILYFFPGCSSTYYGPSLEPPSKFKRELDLLKTDVNTPGYQKESDPILTNATTPRATRYTVKRGDTIWRIAYGYGVSPDTIIKHNHIKDVTDIKPGQQLIIPAGFTGTKRTSSGANLTLAKKSYESFIWPLQGKIISRFDQWVDNERNTGIDIQAYNGQVVKASKRGIVAMISDTPDGWGRVVILQHDDGSYTWYAYNSEILVKKGDNVTQGHIIARAGSTGRAKQDKLHFKIFLHGMPVNPSYYLGSGQK